VDVIFWRKKKNIEEIWEEFRARKFHALAFSWEPREVESVTLIPSSSISIEFLGGRGREIQARIVSSDEGVIHSSWMAYERLYGASFSEVSLDAPGYEGLLITLTTDRLYVFTKFSGPDESLWNHLLKILNMAEFFEAHLLIAANREWIDYAEAFTHLVKRLSEGVVYVVPRWGTKKFGPAAIPQFKGWERVKVSSPIWQTVGGQMARSAQEKVHGSPMVMSIDILLRGENAHSIMNSLSGVASSWRSDWDYGYFIPVIMPTKGEVKRLRRQGFRVDEKLLRRIYYGVWRRFLLREFRIGTKTWERLATLQGQFIDFYHPLPMVLDEVQAFLKLPNDPSLPIRYKREKRVDVYAFQDEEEGFEIGKVV